VQIIGRGRTLKGRSVGILVDDGSDAAAVAALRKAAEAAGAMVKIVAPKVGGAKLGRQTPAGRRPARRHAIGGVRCRRRGACPTRPASDWQWRPRSTSCATPSATSRRSPFDAGGKAVLDAGGIEPDAGVVEAGDPGAFVKAAKTRQWAREPKVRTLP
jgi:catalase